MTTRTYYLPKSRIALHVLNYMVAKIGCSVGDIKTVKTANMIRVPITCNDNDIGRIEKILKRYDMIGE